MFNMLSKWKVILTVIFLLVVSSVVYSFTMNDEFCSVIDDSRVVDSIAVVNKFNDSKVSYYVDYQKSYQILVEKSQIDEAYIALISIGISTRSKYDSNCKVVR